MQREPDWMEEWVIFEPGNWHLKPDAPADIVAAFKEYMHEDEGEIK